MIHEIARQNLMEVRGLLTSLNNEQLSIPLQVLDGASLGKHVRHILEFYQCLFLAADGNRLNYDLRKRDPIMEVNRDYAICCIDSLMAALDNHAEDFSIRLMADFSMDGDRRQVSLETTYFRELLYNIEHCVHHLAIIKIGINDLNPEMILDPNLGVSASTQRSNSRCVQ